MGKGASKSDSNKSLRKSTSSRSSSTSVTFKPSNALVFGGNGNLGSIIVKSLKKANCKVITVDFRANEFADETIIIGTNTDQWEVVHNFLAEKFIRFDLIVNVAGGFEIGNLKSADLMKNLSKMIEYNVKPAVGASQIASQFLESTGMLIHFGAAAALKETPTMLAYGLAKAAVHNLVKTLAAGGSGMPEGSTVCAILPVIMDTPTNRQDFPNGYFSNWTPLEHVAEKIVQWLLVPPTRPSNGSLVGCETKKGITTWKSAENVSYSFEIDSSARLASNDRVITSKSLSDLLTNANDRIVFRAQLKDEFATENLDFYDAVSDFNSKTNDDALFVTYTNIYETYVRPSASRTVNLADPTRQKLGQIATKQIPLTKDCFKEAQLEVLHMLDGTFTRLRK